MEEDMKGEAFKVFCSNIPGWGNEKVDVSY